MFSKSHDDGFDLGILLQTVFPQFAPGSRLFKSAEWGSGVKDVIAIYPDSTRAHAVGYCMSLLDVTSPNAGGQPIDCSIRAGNDIRHISKADYTHHGPEDLFLCNRHLILYIDKHGGLDEVTPISDALSTAGQTRTFPPPRVDVAHDSVELILIDLRALFGCGINRISNNALPSAFYTFFHESIVNIVFDKHSRSCAADLTLVGEEAIVGALHHFVQLGIREDNVWTFATKLQRDPFEI